MADDTVKASNMVGFVNVRVVCNLYIYIFLCYYCIPIVTISELFLLLCYSLVLFLILIIIDIIIVIFIVFLSLFILLLCPRRMARR